MPSRQLPKRIRAEIAKHPERYDLNDSAVEQDIFGDTNGWSRVYLAPGWRNAVLDPCMPLHLIHESVLNIKETLRQMRGIQPCDCESCKAELERVR